MLKSKPILAIGDWSRKHFGSRSKRIAKLIPWMAGNGALWFVMGFWHGSIQHILGVSLWYWSILSLSEIFKPVFEKITKFFGVNTESFSFHLFQSIRTYVVYSLGVVFFSAPGLRNGIHRYAILFDAARNLNPWIFFDGSITSMGVIFIDVNILVLGVAALLVVAVLRERHGYARTWMQKQILPFRWIVWISLFVIVLVYGLYGPGYDAASFIYDGF